MWTRGQNDWLPAEEAYCFNIALTKFTQQHKQNHYFLGHVFRNVTDRHDT